MPTIKYPITAALGCSIALALLAGCSTDEQSSSPAGDPRSQSTAVAEPGAEESSGPVGGPEHDGPLSPKHVDELSDDPTVASREAIGCLFAYDATTMTQPQDAYDACRSIFTDDFTDYLDSSAMADDITPISLDFDELVDADSTTDSITLETTDDGMEVGEGEGDDMIIPTYNVELRFTGDDSPPTAAFTLDISMVREDGHWLVDYVVSNDERESV